LRNIDLSKYWPEVIKNVREFKQISDAENPEFNILQIELENVINDQFVLDNTINGVNRREKMFKIIPKASDTLDERKFRILARINEDIPFTVPNLHNQLKNLCGEDGYSLTILNNDFTVIVKVALTSKNNFNSVQELLERVIPQNMIIDCILMYNQHLTLANYTHNQLHQFTHNYIRNEVLS
jgi:hypothetical protein